MNILTIFIFILVIILIYAVYKLMTKTTTNVSGFSDASKPLSVPCAKFGLSQNYGYSVWIYVDSWITNSASSNSPSDALRKNILTRCTTNESNTNTAVFNLYLDNAQNNLKLLMNGTTNPCNIKNIKLQKWVNITMSVNGNTVDLYLDGKLVRTCVLTAIPIPPKTADTLFVGGAIKECVASEGDLRGYISNVVYKSDYFTPEEAWNIYSAGYSGAGTFDFVNRYKLNFSIIKDDQTVVGATI
jgi:hypothetical protein